METTFLSAGLACLIAAIVGGGLKAFGIEIPVMSMRFRQAAKLRPVLVPFSYLI